MSKFILPNFFEYRPHFIEKSIKEISKSRLYTGDYGEREHDDKYLIAVNQLLKTKTLNKKEIKHLAYYLVSLERADIFMDYYKIFVANINIFINNFAVIRQFISFLYNGVHAKDKEMIFNILKILAKKQYNKKIRYDELFSVIISSAILGEFLNNIKDSFSSIRTLDEIDTLARICFLKPTDSFYHSCISSFIVNNYLDEELWGFYLSKVEVFKLEYKKRLFKDILAFYKEDYDIKAYPKKWFTLIGKELGDPYERVNPRWRGLEEEKEIYRRWNVTENLDKFFDEIVGGDRDRKYYWRNYVNNIFRIEYFEEASKALVMQFKDHIFVEFATVGNAMYYYHKDDISIDKIKQDLDSMYYRYRISSKTSYLKQKNLAINKLNHAGSWQEKCDYIIRSLGYEKSRWI